MDQKLLVFILFVARIFADAADTAPRNLHLAVGRVKDDPLHPPEVVERQRPLIAQFKIEGIVVFRSHPLDDNEVFDVHLPEFRVVAHGIDQPEHRFPHIDEIRTVTGRNF